TLKTYSVNTGANIYNGTPAYPYSECGGKVTVGLDAPASSAPWLSRKGTGSDGIAYNYELAIKNAKAGSRDRLSPFIINNDICCGRDVAAYYYNAGDLGLGREMHCRQGGYIDQLPSAVACYVTNYGAPGGPHETAFNDMF